MLTPTAHQPRLSGGRVPLPGVEQRSGACPRGCGSPRQSGGRCEERLGPGSGKGRTPPDSRAASRAVTLVGAHSSRVPSERPQPGGHNSRPRGRGASCPPGRSRVGLWVCSNRQGSGLGPPRARQPCLNNQGRGCTCGLRFTL